MGRGLDATHPKVFRGYRKNALADLDEIRHSFAPIYVTPTLTILTLGQVRSRNYDVIHDVMFGPNSRILRSIAAE